MIVDIITVHFGKIQFTLSLLKNIKKLGYLRRLILVNNSSPSVGNQIKREFPQIILINNKRNLGYGAALNKGIKISVNKNSQYILILNNDVIIKKNIIKSLINFSLKGGFDIVSPKVLDTKGRNWFLGGEIDKNRFTAGHSPDKYDFLSGCCLLIKTEVFKKIGFFDQSYFLYYEDVDFCYRASKANLKLGIDKNTIIYHQTKKNQNEIKVMDYYLAKNHILFLKKYAPLRVKIRELIRLPKTIIDHIKKGQISALKGVINGYLKFIAYITIFFN